MKFCKNCGTQLDDAAMFCNNCGAAAEQPASQQAAPQQAAPQQSYQQQYAQQPYQQPYGQQAYAQQPYGQPYVKQPSGLATAAKILMIVGTVLMGLYIIPLAWCIPMTITYCNKLKNNEPISTGFKVCCLLFVSMIGGILMLCDKD